MAQAENVDAQGELAHFVGTAAKPEDKKEGAAPGSDAEARFKELDVDGSGKLRATALGFLFTGEPCS